MFLKLTPKCIDFIHLGCESREWEKEEWSSQHDENYKVLFSFINMVQTYRTEGTVGPVYGFLFKTFLVVIKPKDWKFPLKFLFPCSLYHVRIINSIFYFFNHLTVPCFLVHTSVNDLPSISFCKNVRLQSGGMIVLYLYAHLAVLYTFNCLLLLIYYRLGQNQLIIN